MDNYRKTLEFVCGKIYEAYEIASKETLVFYDKGKFDEVSSLDFAAESYLINEIKLYDRKGQILSEELQNTTILHDRTWVVDPIDGTCNLTHGISLFGIQCALF